MKHVDNGTLKLALVRRTLQLSTIKDLGKFKFEAVYVVKGKLS